MLLSISADTSCQEGWIQDLSRKTKAKERLVHTRADMKHTQQRSSTHAFALESKLLIACHVTDGGLAGNEDTGPRIWEG